MQRYFSNIKNNNIITIENDDIYHIVKVMRMKTNDKIEVVFDSKVFICEIEIEKLPEVFVVSEIKSNDINLQKTTLIVPLLKEQKMDIILQKATELGVDEIIPVIMKRSIVKVENLKEDKKIERWTKICKEASEQSKRNSIPVVTNIMTLNELKDITGLKLVCSTKPNEKSIKKFLTENENYDRISIVVGPEGGISESEEELLVRLGFTRVSLGSRIMRVETVPIYILSVLNYENMER